MNRKLLLMSLFVFTFILCSSMSLAAMCGNVSSISLSSPSDGFATSSQADAVNFNFMWTSNPVSSLLTGCQLELYDVEDGNYNFTGSSTSSTANSSSTLLVDSAPFIANYGEGIYEWNVGCYTNISNSCVLTYAPSNNTIIFALPTSAPVLYNLPSVVTTNPVNIVGYTGRNGSANITVTSDDYLNPYTNQTSASAYATTFGSTSIIQKYNESFFRVNDNLAGNITSGNYVTFSNHNRTSFLHYQIITVIPVLDYYRVEVSPTPQVAITAGDVITVYDQDRPSGWFNMTVQLY